MSKKTVAAIVKGGNNYIIEVKGNQPKLQTQIKKNIEEVQALSIDSKEERNRGREEIREAYLYDNTKDIDPEWTGIKRLIKVIRRGTRKGKAYNETHYFISSLEDNEAQLYAKAIRAHWGIENRLHYVKDVNINEDDSGIKGESSAENLSIIKNIVINIFRANGMQSIKKATRKYVNKINDQMKLLRNTYIDINHI